MTAGDPAHSANHQAAQPSGSAPLRLGDLLTSAGLLKAEELRQAMLIAKSQSLPVGRVIIMSGFMSEQHLQAAVQCQSLLKDGLLNTENAVAALRTLYRENCTLDEALQKLGIQQGGPTNKLGELLIEAGLVTKEQLEASLVQGQTSGLPLGRVLVVTGILTEQMLASVLNAQILIRDKRVDREQAISSLKAARDRQVPLEQTLAETGIAMPNAETVRLGELLVMAKLLEEAQLMQIVEVGLVKEQPIGQVLVESGVVNENTLQQALSVQNHVSSGKLRKSLSGQVLELVHNQNLTIEAAIERVQPERQQISNNLPLYQFLQLAGVIGPKDIEDALKAGSRNAQLMGQMLLLTGAVDQNLLQIAMKCSDLMAQGILKAEQAVIALGICWKTKATLEEAFRQLGWSPAIIAAAFPSHPTPMAATFHPHSQLSDQAPGLAQLQAQQQAQQQAQSQTLPAAAGTTSQTSASQAQTMPPTKPIGPGSSGSHFQTSSHQSPLAQALNKGRNADSSSGGLPAVSARESNRESMKRKSDATSASLPALATPGQPALNLLQELETTGDNEPTAETTGENPGIHSGEHDAIGHTPGAAGQLRKKKLSDLIPQIKNQG
ncbi:MAG: hypothetical protein JNN26_25750 [Candidatus Obscuribacter sp.]|nr:hypothetical protein [Candidatus Obscuribacter sp.]